MQHDTQKLSKEPKEKEHLVLVASCQSTHWEREPMNDALTSALGSGSNFRCATWIPDRASWKIILRKQCRWRQYQTHPDLQQRLQRHVGTDTSCTAHDCLDNRKLWQPQFIISHFMLKSPFSFNVMSCFIFDHLISKSKIPSQMKEHRLPKTHI